MPWCVQVGVVPLFVYLNSGVNSGGRVRVMPTQRGYVRGSMVGNYKKSGQN
jgi:hypothetical protein